MAVLPDLDNGLECSCRVRKQVALPTPVHELAVLPGVCGCLHVLGWVVPWMLVLTNRIPVVCYWIGATGCWQSVLRDVGGRRANLAAPGDGRRKGCRACGCLSVRAIWSLYPMADAFHLRGREHHWFGAAHCMQVFKHVRWVGGSRVPTTLFVSCSRWVCRITAKFVMEGSVNRKSWLASETKYGPC
jgi:hypothetical protein